MPSGTGPPQSPTTDVSFAFVDIQTTATETEPTVSFNLDGNYPNPFNPRTTIRYTLTKQLPVSLQVFNAIGRRIAVLVDESQDAGSYEIPFVGDHLAAGVYFYRLRAGGIVVSESMILLP